MNEEPRSEVMCLGTPNPETHAERKAAAHEDDVASTMGTASGQRVEQSTMVKKCLWPSEGGRGPTMSTWTWANRH